MKKYLIIGIVVLLLAASTVAYFLLLKTPKPVVNQKREYALKKLSPESVVSPTASLDMTTIWYLQKVGKIFRYDPKADSMTEYPTPIWVDKPVKKVIWERGGEEFIAIGTTKIGDSFHYYSKSEKKYFLLPPNVVSVDWMPDNERIALVWRSNDKQTQQLVISNPDATGYRVVSQLPWYQFNIRVSPDATEALLLSNKTEVNNNLYLFDLETGQYQTIISDGNTTDAVWIDSKRFLFTKTEAGKNQLYLYDFETSTPKKIELNSSLGQVALETARERFYAAAEVEGTIKFYEVSLNDLVPKNYFTTTEALDIKNMSVVNGTIYFVNEKDDKLYSIE